MFASLRQYSTKLILYMHFFSNQKHLQYSLCPSGDFLVTPLKEEGRNNAKKFLLKNIYFNVFFIYLFFPANFNKTSGLHPTLGDGTCPQ